ncbi:MAG: pyridoxal-phosphate dependent enzyme, partial [Candidatus Adiutrix sp.]
MKVVEHLSETYDVALLNSKNPWRILGQQSYAFEVAQQFDYDLGNLALFVPIGNAGNITAIMSGLLKLKRCQVIDKLPKIVGVQSAHANPVFRYYSQPVEMRKYEPVTVRPSVAQAAMIGNPVSFPRVLKFADEYEKQAGENRFFVVEVSEQNIIDNTIKANRCGLTICTQGGECLAGLNEALSQKIVTKGETALINSTAHALKFSGFQNDYFEDRLGDFDIKANPSLINHPVQIRPKVNLPMANYIQTDAERKIYVEAASSEIAQTLGLKKRVLK